MVDNSNFRSRSILSRNEEPAWEENAYVDVTWQKAYKYPSYLHHALKQARFRTACGPALPQHVWFLSDNKLYIQSYLHWVSPSLLDLSERRTPFIESTSTILGVVFIVPPIDVFPDPQPKSVAVVATAEKSKLLMQPHLYRVQTLFIRCTQLLSSAHTSIHTHSCSLIIWHMGDHEY